MLVQHVKTTVDPTNGQESTQYLEKNTPSFFDMGAKLSYTIPLRKSLSIQLNAGIQNIFDSYQNDFDKGELRDAKYIYGPALPRSVTFGAKITL